VKAAVYLAALDFEAQMKKAGYDVIFWCGKPTEAVLRDASVRMASEGNAVLPEGALPLSNPACSGAFDVNLLWKKVRVKDAGFSLYSKGAGMGMLRRCPMGFEGEIDG